MDAARSLLALAYVALLVPMLGYWPVLHGCLGFWRRLGPRPSLAILWGGLAAAALGIVGLRDLVWRTDLGTSWPTATAGCALLGLAGLLRVPIQRAVSNALLVGIPELAPGTCRQPLVTAGIYGRLRHPRYVQLLVALLGWALVANHGAAYAVWGLWFVGVHGIVRLEERELAARYGEAWTRYCAATPRWVPRRR